MRFSIAIEIKFRKHQHATLLKGGATLPNLRIPILPSKTIDFQTFKT